MPEHESENHRRSKQIDDSAAERSKRKICERQDACAPTFGLPKNHEKHGGAGYCVGETLSRDKRRRAVQATGKETRW
jgi:hypothetical protein